MTQEELKMELEELAVRFSKGWHEGIKIDASDIMLLNEAAQALAQPEQEPICPDCKAKVLYECVACSSNNYPPQRKPLTDDQLMEIYLKTNGIEFYKSFARAIEAAHGIKENT